MYNFITSILENDAHGARYAGPVASTSYRKQEANNVVAHFVTIIRSKHLKSESRANNISKHCSDVKENTPSL